MLIFDTETDGLLDTSTVIHSLIIFDTEAKQWYSCAGQSDYIPIEEGLKLLAEAPAICGHNIINHDVPVLKKLYPKWRPQGRLVDTLICTRLIWPDLRADDIRNITINKNRPASPYSKFPKNIIGSHSLKAWGYRIQILKDTFGETADWKTWSPEMQGYCQQDVSVTYALWNLIQSMNYSPEALALEHSFATIIAQQERDGFPFDTLKAAEYYSQLSAERKELTEELQALFPPKDKGTWFVPKVNNAARGYIKGQRVWKPKIIEFNPGSRLDIFERLKETHNWKPEEYTEKGTPKIDDAVLSALPWPEAQRLAHYFLLQKRIGQLAEGSAAWLKKVEPDGRIHGRVITNGAVTGRCTHRDPNLAQVPAVGVPWGHEFRGLFYAPEGHILMGCDASGLELRCLAHYITRFDEGAYRDIILSGDIHWANTLALGLIPKGTERDHENPEHNHARAIAKRFIYAFLYGAGNAKLGSILHPEQKDEEKLKKAGGALRRKFLTNLPAMGYLTESVAETAKRNGYLKGIDKRRLPIRSPHAALNTLLQSAGAIIVKKATCLFHEHLQTEGLAPYVQQVVHVHDEFQCLIDIAKDPTRSDTVGELAVKAFNEAGEHFNFRCPIDGEYKLGHNWAETH